MPTECVGVLLLLLMALENAGGFAGCRGAFLMLIWMGVWIGGWISNPEL